MDGASGLSLDGLRESFLARVAEDARRREQAAAAERAARLAQARAQVVRMRREAAELGAAEGDQDARSVRAAAERELRARRLRVRGELYEDLRRSALAAASALRREPRHAALMDALTADVRRELGERAQVERDPGSAGGVIGRSGSRLVDLTLPALAGRCLDSLGPRVQELWR